MKNSSYTLGEEIANSVTHGVGAVLSAVGMVLLVAYAIMDADPLRIVSACVFGGALFFMYLASTLYHALPHPPAKRILRTVDHCAIFVLIAGTYTPFLLVSMQGPWGWSLLAVMWLTAAAGCLFKILATGKWELASVMLYVAMGWTVVVAFKPAVEMVPGGALALLLIGGLAYTAGVVFYLWNRLPYNHAIWHVFVMAGSLVHFIAIFLFVVPGAADTL